MSGPRADQPAADLSPGEVERLLAIYRAHLRHLEEPCSCGRDGCTEGSTARYALWMRGVNPVTGR